MLLINISFENEESECILDHRWKQQAFLILLFASQTKNWLMKTLLFFAGILLLKSCAPLQSWETAYVVFKINQCGLGGRKMCNVYKALDLQCTRRAPR